MKSNRKLFTKPPIINATTSLLCRPTIASSNHHLSAPYYAYNSEVDKDSYIARIDREDCKDHAAFIDGVKNKDWERVQETMSKNDDIFSIGGSKNEKEEEVLYAARYIHGLDD